MMFSVEDQEGEREREDPSQSVARWKGRPYTTRYALLKGIAKSVALSFLSLKTTYYTHCMTLGSAAEFVQI
jgi:hypothetical protein